MFRMTVEYDEPADPAAFESRYTDEHVPLVRSIPGLTRFVLSHPKGAGGSAPYLVAELWWDDEASFKAALKTPEMAATGEHAQGCGTTYRTFVGEVVDTL
ncbi:EthD family reductase [Nocardioides sp. KR10-350]|uniref:EthD family reductase n=1 Tax=Nocardioides cheoyonin TaxID=3156615 RepID=UPI0032B573C3